jgi:hypothetical protein
VELPSDYSVGRLRSRDGRCVWWASLRLGCGLACHVWFSPQITLWVGSTPVMADVCGGLPSDAAVGCPANVWSSPQITLWVASDPVMADVCGGLPSDAAVGCPANVWSSPQITLWVASDPVMADVCGGLPSDSAVGRFTALRYSWLGSSPGAPAPTFPV